MAGSSGAAIAEAIMLICSCREAAFLFYYYDFLLLLIVGSHGGDEAPINLAASGAYNEERRERQRGGRGSYANGERRVEVACATLNRPYLSIIKAIWKQLPPFPFPLPTWRRAVVS